jgi:hypothetical protein
MAISKKQIIISLLVILYFPSTDSLAQIEKNLLNNKTLYGKEYYPINAGLKLVYNTNLGEGYCIIDSLENGFKLSYTLPGIVYAQYLELKDNVVLVTKAENKILLWQNEYFYPSPIPRLIMPFTVEQKWSWSGIEIYKNDSISTIVEVEILEQEYISTPAGNFYCIPVSTNIISADGTEKRSIEWLAKNIGLVKANIKMKGTGIPFLIQKLFGLDEINFELKEIRNY